MTGTADFVRIAEEGPREGFQIEPGPISTAAKIELIDALSRTGVRQIQAASFVNPKAVPGWADAEAVVEGILPVEGVTYGANWLNARGMERALAHADVLTCRGAIALSASEAFSLRNLRRDRAGQIEMMTGMVREHLAAGVPIDRLVIMASFGCNFAGEVATEQVVATVADGLAIAADCGVAVEEIILADSMGWCSPERVAALVGAMGERWPDATLALHLHDTRGLGIASAYEGLRLGVRRFDSAVAGLGGCPFAGQPGAPGNIATEELVLLCERMGLETGIDLDAMIEAGRLAERIVGHPLPSSLLRSAPMRVLDRACA